MRKLWESKVSRRKLLGGAAATGAAIPVLHEMVPHQDLHGGTSAAQAAVEHHRQAHRGSGHLGAVGRVDARANGFDPNEIVRDFDEGTLRGGVREWDIVAQDREIEVAPGVKYAAWAYNGRVPGPTLRARQGERLRINFTNGSNHPHTIHFHGIHRDVMDGVPGIGPGNIGAGKSTVYEFDAVNTVAFAYMDQPIRVKRGELVRIYLVNVLEFDFLNSFHIHANFFDYYPTGTRLEPRDFTDTVIQGQGERGILELRFPYTGKYMFHAHVSEFAELGWMGFFDVTE